MEITEEDKQHIILELISSLNAKKDGTGKNLLVPECPYCGHSGYKFGIYIGKPIGRKQPFMAHCFSCGHSVGNVNTLLKDLGRPDLAVTETFKLDNKLQDDFSFMEDEELDDELVEIDMPEFYNRTWRNSYLKKRGFTRRDYEFFEAGTTRGFNFKFDDYVIFPIIEEGCYVGYVSRHTASKQEIDAHNEQAKRDGTYRIMRYRNSVENDFVKLLYNYDNVIDGETDTVIIVEGVFDAIALTRKLELYDNHRVAVVATFGKKISDVQVYKLQRKGVENIVIGYDGDATAAINKTAAQLSDCFENVLIADIPDENADFDDMDFWDIFDVFSQNLKTIVEYKLTHFI